MGLIPQHDTQIQSPLSMLHRSPWLTRQQIQKRAPPFSAIRADIPGLKAPIELPLASPLLFASSTGTKIWNGAILLSQLLLLPDLTPVCRQQPSLPVQLQSLRGRRVIELGAGLGVCSIAAGLAGAHVVATDGDAGVVRLLSKALAHNLRRRSDLLSENMAALSSQVEENPSQETTTAHACMLPWGEAQAGQRVLDLLGSQPPDVILMAECVYGSDPSVWAKLVATLQQLAAPHTLILQAESRRIEMLLQSEYMSALQAAGFTAAELDVMSLGLHGWGRAPVGEAGVVLSGNSTGSGLGAGSGSEAGGHQAPVRAWAICKA